MMTTAGTIPIAGRVADLRPTAVNSILAEVRATPGPLVSLMRGEPDLPTPPHIVEAAAKALAAGRTMYPDNRGEPKLRAAIAEKLRRDNGLDYDPATEILVTTGGTFGIYAALAAMLNPGDAVLVPDPVYDAYLSPIRLTGAIPVPVPAEIVDGRFVLTVAALEAAWTPRCKALLLNTPWNPTGTVFTRDELAAIVAFCEQRDLSIVSDEIYEAIVYEGNEHISPASLYKHRTVLVNALSKTYAMTGWRVGYVAAPPAFVRAMLLILQQSSRGPATFVQDAAAVAVVGPQDSVAAMRAEYTRRRSQVLAALPHVLPPQGGFFAMLDLRELRVPSDIIRRRLLAEFGVVVVHGAAYGPAGEGTLRVSFASGGDVLEKGLAKLREALRVIG
ncbi:MAG: aminotransferase class I/II-fold pyridoxal phosphate-dependent enzyme [Bryobacterales bacterium]|nr:aminotransferase class I/II-fold pyridoxal phosphate-dependent enzyme [Bryobacterales bacterium]